FSNSEKGLWLIADGMGGHAAGEVASAIARDTIAEAFGGGTPLCDAVQKAHSAILQAVDDKIGAPGMGSTVVALQSKKDGYEVAWVGDSRAYLWSPNEPESPLNQITTDHSYVQMLLASGAIKEEEVAHHPDKNIITQCLGVQDIGQVKVDSVHGNWQQGQWILLCSDGLNEEVDDNTITEILAQASNPGDAVDQLIARALESGGHDNVTVQVIAAPNSSNVETAELDSITDGTQRNYLLYGLLCAALLLLLLSIL
ncbi:MAG: PP2C family protein-serine/threonine phosphatase, partial [Pseudomonadales bacterium]